MRIGTPKLWILIFSGTGVLLIAVVDMNRTSPGPLSAVHGRLEELAGQDGCAKCHGGFTSSLSDSCLECHSQIAKQIEQSSGLHGILDSDRALKCALCHTDHHGATFSIVNLRSFVEAGIPDPKQFDHASIGYQMAGRHLELDCVDCHTNADEPVLPPGEKRFLGLDQSCTTCHEDPHAGRMESGCTSCHNQEDWSALSFVEHHTHLPLIGSHADLGCRDCHAAETPHALESPLPGVVRADSRECQDCHESPHRSSFIGGIAQVLATTTGASCGECHQAEHRAFGQGDVTVTQSQHESTGFSLTPPHENLPCASCHAPQKPEFASRYPGRSADECRACHGDPHERQFDRGPFASSCLSCHERHRFTPHNFTIALHEKTSMPLTGSHVDTDCQECHRKPDEKRARIFHGTPGKCEECHRDPHAGFFDERGASVLSENRQGACAHCHVTTKFSEPSSNGFDHARWTGFPLEGAHGLAGCESCHARSEHPDDLGRSFGRITEHYGPLKGCVTCHRDPHQGQFDRPELPATVEDRAGCARCHVETSFRTLRPRFDHRKWTGFALDGAHGDVSCSACHRPLQSPTPEGRRYERAKGSSCADCHSDPHGGQFKADNENNCQRCHQSGFTFSEITFNHNLDSRFPLGKTHASVACSACHRTVRRNGIEMVHYRPLGTKCVDCHGDNRQPFIRRKRGRR